MPPDNSAAVITRFEFWLIFTDSTVGRGPEWILNVADGDQRCFGLVACALELVFEITASASASVRYILPVPGQHRNRFLQRVRQRVFCGEFDMHRATEIARHGALVVAGPLSTAEDQWHNTVGRVE